jgi:nucleoside-diphosphate-sugar epimerase
LIGFDSGFFAGCLMNPGIFPEARLNAQYFGDVRFMPDEILKGADAVIQLAAVSNDPMGNAFEKPTIEINSESTAAIGCKAKAAGVHHFVFASSCSIYGSAGEEARSEGARLNPLTAYARSKVASEKHLEPLADRNFIVTCLRFATACGYADRLRLDLVLNDFVASAVATGKITLLSDGRAFRPLIHVADMARLMHWGCERPVNRGGAFFAANAGRNDWNYRIRDLAEAVAGLIPGTEVTFSKDAQSDSRSYRVNFDLLTRWAPEGIVEYDLTRAVRELYEGLTERKFKDPDFRKSDFIRLKVLRDLVDSGRIDSGLHWRTAS